MKQFSELKREIEILGREKKALLRELSEMSADANEKQEELAKTRIVLIQAVCQLEKYINEDGDIQSILSWMKSFIPK